MKPLCISISLNPYPPPPLCFSLYTGKGDVLLERANITRDVAVNIIMDAEEMQEIIASPRVREAFRKFATRFHCEENVGFLIAVHEYEKLVCAYACVRLRSPPLSRPGWR